MTSSTRPSQPDHTDSADQADVPAHRRLRRDATANRLRLLEAARTVFAQRGLGAGVEEVAQVAGVGIGTLYRRFPTKDALIAELVHELVDNMLTLARRAQQVDGGRGLEQFLYAMGEAQAGNRGCLARIWTDDTSSALRTEYRKSLAALIADAKAHTTIRSDAAVTDIDLLFWSLRGIIEATGDISDTAWRRLVAVTLAGLRPSDQPLDEAPITEDLVTRARQSVLRNPGS